MFDGQAIDDALFRLFLDRAAVSDLVAPFWQHAIAQLLAGLVLCLWLLRSPRLTAGMAAISIVAGYVVMGLQMIPNALVARVVEPLFPRLAAANTDTFLYLGLVAAWLALILRLVPASARSRDRLVWVIVTGAMLITTILFHVLFIHGAMTSAFKQTEQRLNTIAGFGEPAYREACRAFFLVCIDLPDGTELEAEVVDRFVPSGPFLTLYRRSRTWAAASGTPDSFGFSTGDILSGGPYAVHYRRDPGRGSARLLIDSASVWVPYNAQETIFKLQMAIAHTVWFVGGVLVVVGHRRWLARPRPAPALGGAMPLWHWAEGRLPFGLGR